MVVFYLCWFCFFLKIKTKMKWICIVVLYFLAFYQACTAAKSYGSSRSIVRRIAASLPLKPCPRVHFQVRSFGSLVIEPPGVVFVFKDKSACYSSGFTPISYSACHSFMTNPGHLSHLCLTHTVYIMNHKQGVFSLAEQICLLIRSLIVHLKSCTLLIIHSSVTFIWWNVVFENFIFLTFLSSSTLLPIFFPPLSVSSFPSSLCGLQHVCFRSVCTENFLKPNYSWLSYLLVHPSF